MNFNKFNVSIQNCCNHFRIFVFLELEQSSIEDEVKKGANQRMFSSFKSLFSNEKNRNGISKDMIFKGRNTKDAIVGNKTKETIGGKKVNVEQIDSAENILKEETPKLLSANIVLPDTTNSNTHIVDTFLSPGKLFLKS